MFLVLDPNSGAVPFRLGMDRSQVRSMLATYRLLTLPSEPENDKYPSDGLILGYDLHDKLEYIEVTKPSAASYKEIYFVGENVRDVVQHLTDLGFSPSHDVGSYVFPSINLSIYAPADTVLSVSLFREGYYENATK